MSNNRNATAWLHQGKIVLKGQESEELREHLEATGLLPTKEKEMATSVYRHEGKKYTAETLAEAPESFIHELRRRGVRTPETEALPAAKLSDVDGVGGEMEAALKKAGYKTVKALANASIAELQEVAGIGPKSAPRIIESAKGLYGFESGADAGDESPIAPAPGATDGG